MCSGEVKTTAICLPRFWIWNSIYLKKHGTWCVLLWCCILHFSGFAFSLFFFRIRFFPNYAYVRFSCNFTLRRLLYHQQLLQRHDFFSVFIQKCVIWYCFWIKWPCTGKLKIWHTIFYCLPLLTKGLWKEVQIVALIFFLLGLLQYL